MKVTSSPASAVPRIVLVGMVTSDQVVTRLAPKWPKGGLFASRWENLLGLWCVNYFRKYNKAPGKAIEGMFARWAQEHAGDKETVGLVEDFLSGLAGEYAARAKQVNPEFVIDQAGQHFNEVLLTRLRDEIDGDISVGKPDDALKRMANFRKLEIGLGSYVDVFQDTAALSEAVEAGANAESLVKYPGALGEFYGAALARENFVAILAPMKRGKTWQTVDLAHRAVMQRRRVAYFQVGDLTRNQQLARIAIRTLGRPLRAKKYRYPVAVEKDRPVWEEREVTDTIAGAEAARRMQKWYAEKVKSTESYLRLSVHANSALSMEGMAGILDDWDRDGWTPDIVVIDYADILAAPQGYSESRDGVNHNWKAMRRLSQERHCLVVTATQANAKSFNEKDLDMGHFSEDNRKFAHVTGMLGLNQTAAEKKDGLMRYNWLVLREEEFHIRDFVKVVPCLAIGNPCVRSFVPTGKDTDVESHESDD